MFDPTIYDNLKVVLEGCIYDLDLEKELLVSKRKDIIDTASMSRTFYIEFQLQKSNGEGPYAGISLHFSLNDYTTEVVNGDVESAGCNIDLSFYTIVSKEQANEQCQRIEEQLTKLWNNQALISQELSFSFRNDHILKNKITIDFQRKINETQVYDLESIVHHSLKSLILLRTI